MMQGMKRLIALEFIREIPGRAVSSAAMAYEWKEARVALHAWDRRRRLCKRGEGAGFSGWPLLLLIALAVVLWGSLGCGSPCSIHGCPEGEVCSLATERCMDPEDVYGPPCPSGPKECHRGVCLQLPPEEGGSVCSGTCQAGDPPCPDGFRCMPVSDGLGTTMVCVPVGEGAVGDDCEVDADCESRLCLPLESGAFCSDFCADDPSVCGDGNVACLTLYDTTDTPWELCVKGGDSRLGESCPNGVVDCDLTETEICLASADNTVSFCTIGCPGGPSDCEALSGGCCVDLGEDEDPEEHFCLPAPFCPCEPSCFGRNCGPDGCGGVCGVCDDGEVCENGQCVECVPDCDGRECGPDECGGQCGACAAGEQCVDGACEGSCTPDCQGRECGPDGCGGLCGLCTSDERCHDGSCVHGALLLVDLMVRDPNLDPAPLWGLGEYQGAPSIGPPVEYGQGPQDGTTQQSLCGETVSCSEDDTIVTGRSYELRLGFHEDGQLERCVASFYFDGAGDPSIDAADCLLEAGGPFEEVFIEGAASSFEIYWALP